ncbi:MAG: DinB family protein [Acidimicrobiia bacterium]|nr:DinB family protein [Acidimicrobiia bacterium]
MSTSQPEPWLRGPVPGIPPLLQPAAHAFLLAVEDVETAVAGLSPQQLWFKPGGAASLGFHLLHLSGSTRRLLAYARGESLSSEQRAELASERAMEPPYPGLEELVARWRTTVDNSLRQLAATPEATLNDSRLVGRAELPSTVLGLLFHAAEHAQRHVGQIVATSKIVKRVFKNPLNAAPGGGASGESWRS